MAIAYVQEFGGGNSTQETTLVINVPAGGTTQGNFLVLGCVTGAATSYVASVADSKGNTWTVDKVSSVGRGFSICSAQLTTALVSGDTITITPNASTFSAANVAEFSGVATSAPVDQSAGHGVSVADGDVTTGTTATLAAADELQFAGAGRPGSTTALTDITTGMSALTNRLSTGTVRTCYTRYKLNVGTAGVEYSGTFTATTQVHDECTVAYKAAGGAPPSIVTGVPQRMLMGVGT